MSELEWRSGAAIETLKKRAALLANLRQFFAERNVVEIDSPVAGRYGITDRNIQSVAATVAGESAWLQTSPEYFLKRLLAQGLGDCYSLGKVFRDGEIGRRHNPEFTLLEWYRLGWDEHQLMVEVRDLVQQVCPQLDIETVTYTELFEGVIGCNPHTSESAQLIERAQKLAGHPLQGLDRSSALDLIFSLAVEPTLADGLVMVHDYPACQAALARLHQVNGVTVARRFEVYLNGVELANGYNELTDWVEQQQRFAADNSARQSRSDNPMAIDAKFGAALQHGLPACSGVALGVDRLLMAMLEVADIEQVLPFSWPRC